MYLLLARLSPSCDASVIENPLAWLQDSEYIARLWCEAIEEAGPENVMHFVSDSAANCKKAGETIESR